MNTHVSALRTVDVSDLSPQAVLAVENLIRAFRGQPLPAELETDWVLSGPQPGETPEAWFLRFMSQWARLDSGTYFVDDSRDAIYGDEGG